MPVGRPFFLTLGTSAARRTSSTPAGSTAGERGDECRQEDPLLLARPCRVDHFPLDECHQEDPISFLARPCRVDRSLYPDECRQEDPIFFFGASLQGRPSSSVDRFSPFRQPFTSHFLISHLTSLSVFFALPCKASLEEPGVTSRTGFEGMQSLRSARRHHALPDEGKQQRVSLY